jgi:hypothetical protein
VLRRSRFNSVLNKIPDNKKVRSVSVLHPAAIPEDKNISREFGDDLAPAINGVDRGFFRQIQTE